MFEKLFYSKSKLLVEILSRLHKSSSFQKLLEKDNSVTIHHRNIKILATERYKFLRGLSPPLMNDIFVERINNYSLRGNNILTRRRVNSMRYGTETVSFTAPKMWTILPKETKILNLVIFSKEKSKNGFHGYALTDFVRHGPQVGFIWVVKIKDTYHLLKLTSISFPIIGKMLV